MAFSSLNFFRALLLLFLATSAFSTRPYKEGLTPHFYDYACPQALPAVQRIVEAAVQQERRMGASLLRLHFHDCFVNGCDASILLDPSPTIDSEKLAFPNNNSARGFEVIDQIKAEVDKACGYSLVSCADILAIAARDSVVALGGPSWEVQLGRRDSTRASRTTANTDIPAPNMDLPSLISTFQKQGLDTRDLVALSGAHTIGFAQCRVFRNRTYNDANIAAEFAGSLRSLCPRTGEDSNLAGLDPSPAQFDALYFHNLLAQKGLLHSDQALYSGGSTDELVKTYSDDAEAFWDDFAKSMIKMGNIKPLIGNQGQIRLNCRKVN
ncbi:hypothetical protein ACJRO7_000811 [Eucalyptus globulus]|uniref:Peroxidase n=1 Tax=Eucalyptus globulus TaxID=34317 RepID=A0ABD3LNU7_EUCGL